MSHFVKMLIGFTCMALIGVTGLVVVNHYSKQNADASPSATAPVGNMNTSTVKPTRPEMKQLNSYR